MNPALIAVLERRYPGSRVWSRGAATEIVLAVDDVHHAARVRLLPTTEILVDLPAIDGFSLEARWRRSLLQAPRRWDSTLAELYSIRSNDPALATRWLDDVSASLLDERQRSWNLAIGDGVVALRRRGVEDDPEAAALLLAAACRIAAFPWRWAAHWQPIGHALGGRIAERVELGGAPICTVDRGGTTVEIGMCRRVGGDADDDGGLRTWVRARRVSLGEDQLALVASEMRTPPPGLGLGRVASPLSEFRVHASSASAALARLDLPTIAAIEPARAGAVVLARDAVTVWYDGACEDPERLGAAAALCARWAVDRVEGPGPYR